MNEGEQIMTVIEPDTPATGRREIQITIDVPERYVEVVEVHRADENGLVFVQVTSAKVIEPQADHGQNPNTAFGRLTS
jgi:hypothetical protein